MRAPASWLVARPVHPFEELFSRRGQDSLSVRDRDETELRIEVTAVLQVDQQPPARADIRAPVGQRVRHLELVTEPVDELPQLLQRHIVLTPVRPQETGLDEFRPRDVARTRRLYPDHGTVARRTALQPPVQRRRRHSQQPRGGRLGVHFPVKDGDAHAASVTRCNASAYDYLPRLSRFPSGGQRRTGRYIGATETPIDVAPPPVG